MIEAEREAEAEASGQDDSKSETTNDYAQMSGSDDHMSDVIVIADLNQAEEAEQGRAQFQTMKATAQLFAEVRQIITAPDPWIAGAIIQLEYRWEELEGGDLTEDALILDPGTQDLIKVIRGQLHRWTKDARKAAEKAQTKREELAFFDCVELLC